MHPELALEDDVNELLREHEELARMLMEDTEAGHCEMGRGYSTNSSHYAISTNDKSSKRQNAHLRKVDGKKTFC